MAHDALLAELPDLVARGLITADQAERIRAHYATTAPPDDRRHQRMSAVLGIVGATLFGLGLVLVVAHNWSGFSRPVRTLLAFAPVLVGQGLVAFGLWRRPARTVWNEGASVFLAAAVGACLAIVAQLYNQGGDLSDLLLTWAVLILGLCYVPGSAVVGLGYLALITWQAVLVRTEQDSMPWAWALLLAAFLPVALRRIADEGRRVAAGWTGSLLALSIAVGVHLFLSTWNVFILAGTAALASLFAMAPWCTAAPAPGSKAVRGVGEVMLIGLLLMLGSWPVVDGMRAGDRLTVATGTLVAVLVLGAVGVYALVLRRRRPFQGGPLPEGFVGIALLCGLSMVAPWLTALLANLLTLALGVWHVREGTHATSLRRTNLGLLLIAVPVLWRFFEVDLSFVWRGLAFMAIGAAFLLLNLRLLRARKPH